MRSLWYRKPAENWNEALPLGNGFMGAMCFGGTLADRFQLNDDTVWSGGFINRVNASAREALPKVRELIRRGEIAEAEELAQEGVAARARRAAQLRAAVRPDCGIRTSAHPRFSDPFFLRDLTGADMARFEPDGGVSDYRRALDLNQGVHRTEYSLDGVRFSREAFISYPARVMTVRVCGEARVLLRRAGRVTSQRALDRHTLCLEGRTGSDGIAFCCVVRASGEGVDTAGDMLRAPEGCVLYVASATSFREGEDCLSQAVRRLDAAEAMGYEALKAEHLTDVAPLMAACQLELEEDEALAALPSDDRLRRVQKGGNDLGLVGCLFAFGRYLLIASSRPGSLPANLQGIWNESYTPSWDSKYTININTEMNYWPAESCALSEMHLPLFDLLKRMAPRGREVAQQMYGAGGWMAHHNTDIWADCAPQDNFIPSTFWQMGGAWLSLHIWERYLYTLDEGFLREYYPILEGAARFFLDALIPGADGALCVSPSLSPENTYRLPNGQTGCLCEDAAMDQQILHELFTAVMGAAAVLGEDASAYEALCEKLRPVILSGDGLIREWYLGGKEETEIGHRHISHLFALFPGKQITARTPEAFAAARRVVERRLAHGGGHSGWSRAWIIHFWRAFWTAKWRGRTCGCCFRIHAAETCWTTIRPSRSTATSARPPASRRCFCRATRAFSACCPRCRPAWRRGSVRGLKARGGYTVDLDWAENRLVRAEIRAGSEGTLKLQDGRSFRHRKGETVVILASP